MRGGLQRLVGGGYAVEAETAGVLPPESAFGFRMGTDRRLARWPAMLAYFRALAERSDRIRVDELGAATLGQPLVLLTVSSAENLARLPELREIQQRLADPRRRTIAERERLIGVGRCICLMTCSIHATEVGAGQMAPELVHRLITGEDDAARRIRSEVVLLLMPSLNPDGLELVADWYERSLGTPHEGSVPPELYHPYAGHDNNRDWFMQTQVETRLTVRDVHNPWRPQIVLDLHQMQSNGPRYVVPPFIDPYEPNVDPLLQANVNALGTSVAAELTARGKSGVATSVIFDAYSPSRAYAHYHGGVRILAEAASARIATPIRLTAEGLAETRGFDPRLATQNHPLPWPGGVWTLRDIVEYHHDAAWAVLDHAARFRDRWLRHFALVQERATVPSSPSAFLIPALDRQPDPGAAAELVGVLRGGDVEVDRAAAPFEIDGVKAPAGTFVVPVAQPFGRFARALLEPGRYPHLPLYPGGPPRPPYDITAHALPLLMGVEVAAAGGEIDVPVSPVIEPPAVPGGLVPNDRPQAAFAIPPQTNRSARLVNRLLEAGARLHRAEAPFVADDRSYAPGTFVASGVTASTVDAAAREIGVEVHGVDPPPDGRLRRLIAPRVGLYRSWRPNAIDEGWTRFVLGEHGFDHSPLRDRDVRRGTLREAFDAIVLPQQPARDILEGNAAADYPAEIAGGIGEAGAANLRRFAEEGGTLIALDTACNVAIKHLSLPVSNALDGVRSDEFSAPGSLLRLLVDSSHPIGWGMPRESVAMFVGSPAFDVRPGRSADVQVVARYPPAEQLLAGWLNGPERIAGRAAIVESRVGRGRAVLIGFRPQFRAQARATYRLLFNALYRSTLAGSSDGEYGYLPHRPR